MSCYKCERCSCKSAWTRYEFENFYSNKFWEYKREGNTVYVRYGKIGTTGTTVVKSFSYYWQATQYINDKVHEKLAKGYNRA